MRKALVVLSFLSSVYIVNLIAGCVAQSPTSTSSFAQVDAKAAPSAAPTSAAGLDNLKLGVLPGTSLSPDEQSLAELLGRKVKPEFPLKLGVLLYRSYTTLAEKNRKDFYDSFLQKLRENPDVASVTEISPSLVSSGANIEDIRKLAARFQVSTLLLVNDSYQPTAENKEALITPVDIITGNRNWESITNIELFALDILNGVFVYTTSANAKQGDKYNRANPAVNKDDKLTSDSAKEAWNSLGENVTAKISEFKKQFAAAPASP